MSVRRSASAEGDSFFSCSLARIKASIGERIHGESILGTGALVKG